MDTATIHAKAYDYTASAWVVECTVFTSTGIRSGTEIVFGTDTMTDAEIKTALIAKYL